MPDGPQFLALKDFSDIGRLISDGIEESVNLDYKASPALARESKQIDEMCKDISAFANSAGGQIIYGVAEDRATHKPTADDPGITNPKITREWIEQIANSKIQPRISGIRTDRFENGKGGAVFVISVPQSQTGPHQAPDKRYYKRFDLQSVPMEDFEIRDVLKRATTPNLTVDLSFGTSTTQHIEYAAHQETSKPFPIVAHISNNSAQPADYAVIDIGIDRSLTFIFSGDYTHGGLHDDDRGIPLNWFRFIVRPPRIPIFREHGQKLSTQDLKFGFPSSLLDREELFDFAIKIAAPGFSDTTYWTAHFRGLILRFYPPTHPMTATRMG